MRDDLNVGTGLGREGQKRPPRDEQAHPLADREVPLGQPADRPLAATVHAWLDGELPEAAVRKSDSPKDLEFWHVMDSEMARVRRLRTPSHVEAQIMAALPTHAPSMITPWFRREFVITPATAVLTGAALVAASSILTALLFH